MSLESLASPGPSWQEGLDALRAALSAEERWRFEAALGAAASRAAARGAAASRAEMDAVVREWGTKALDRGVAADNPNGTPGLQHTRPTDP